MILQNRDDLLRYFGVRSLAQLDQQFNSDGRSMPVLLDERDGELLIATGPYSDHEVIATMAFPLHVSDLLGRIELDRRAAEILATS